MATRPSAARRDEGRKDVLGLVPVQGMRMSVRSVEVVPVFVLVRVREVGEEVVVVTRVEVRTVTPRVVRREAALCAREGRR